MLRAARASSADGTDWLSRLPGLIRRLCERWQLKVDGPPYDRGMCGWVAPVRGVSGSTAVLKVTWPHPEAAAEGVALRWWDGDGAIRLLAEDSEAWALLLEPCLPGTQLRDGGQTDDDALMIGLAVAERLWDKRIPSATAPPIPSLREVCDGWADLADERMARLRAQLLAAEVDLGMVATAIDLLRTLPRTAARRVVIHGELNPGNLLAAQRAPFLAIDPKPMIGDPAYDPWPLVTQIGWPGRRSDATSSYRHRLTTVAGRLGLPRERLAGWGIARDVEAGLSRVDGGNAAEGIDWLRNLTRVMPLLN